MTLQEIKIAIKAGRTVCWKAKNYVVKGGDIENLSIVCTNNNHSIGLTNMAGDKLNGEECDFFIDAGEGKINVTGYERTFSLIKSMVLNSEKMKAIALLRELSKTAEIKRIMSQHGYTDMAGEVGLLHAKTFVCDDKLTFVVFELTGSFFNQYEV